MKLNNKTCITCGVKYTFCTGCGQFDTEPRWKAIYHNETCKDIFIIVSDFLQNAISKDEAKERLLKCDLSYRNELHEKIQNGIREILDEVKEDVEIIEKKSETVETESKTDENKEIISAYSKNNQPSKMKYYSNNKNKRRN